jgi:hypothetical protein
MRSLAFAVAIGAMAFIPSGNAGAFPAAPGASAGTESSVLQVRDGCGPGMRYSNRMGGCVRDFGPPPPRPGYYPPPPVYVRPAPPPPMYRPGCPPGQRWSNSRGMCVWL